MLRSKIQAPNTVKHSLERLAELLGPGCSDVQHRNNPMLPPGGGQVSHLVNLAHPVQVMRHVIDGIQLGLNPRADVTRSPK